MHPTQQQPEHSDEAHIDLLKHGVGDETWGAGGEIYPNDVEFDELVVVHDEDDENDNIEATEVGRFLSGLRQWVVDHSQTVTAVNALLQNFVNPFQVYLVYPEAPVPW